jgi:hypothetical protein
MECLSGELPRRNSTLSEAKASLLVKVCEYTPPEVLSKPSYYHDKFKVGASIFPRSLYFVELLSKVPGTSQLVVQTAKDIGDIVKKPWKVELRGRVHTDFIYATLLAWEIFPFGYARLRPVVLPVSLGSEGYGLGHFSSGKHDVFEDGTEWFMQAQKVWDHLKTKKAETRFPTLLDRLNYNGLLVAQRPAIRFAVLYNATGSNIASCVVDKKSLPPFQFNGGEVCPRGFVADVKTWFFETNDRLEALYLCTILNSNALTAMIKPLQPRGLYGARAIHRRPLLFPIPRFDAKSPSHVRLAEIGKQCEETVKLTKPCKHGNLRRNIREMLKEEMAEIDEIVHELIEASTGGR